GWPPSPTSGSVHWISHLLLGSFVNLTKGRLLRIKLVTNGFDVLLRDRFWIPEIIGHTRLTEIDFFGFRDVHLCNFPQDFRRYSDGVIFSRQSMQCSQ